MTLRTQPVACTRNARETKMVALARRPDQYKEKKPKDPTIREKFDTYRFKDYKEQVIALLTRDHGQRGHCGGGGCDERRGSIATA